MVNLEDQIMIIVRMQTSWKFEMLGRGYWRLQYNVQEELWRD